jgi:hypothetical protein
MKTRLTVALAAAALMLGAGVANAHDKDGKAVHHAHAHHAAQHHKHLASKSAKKHVAHKHVAAKKAHKHLTAKHGHKHLVSKKAVKKAG